MSLWTANSDRDYFDEPWMPRENAVCAQCRDGYRRQADDTGTLCDRCCTLRDAEIEILDRAEQAIYGALADLRCAVLNAATPNAAHAIHQRVTTVTSYTIQLEKLALDQADRLTKGAA